MNEKKLSTRPLLGLPHSWLQQMLDPGDEATILSEGITLSYFQEFANDLQASRNIKLSDVSEDLEEGFWISKHPSKNKSEPPWYLLHGSNLLVFACTTRGKRTGNILAKVTGIRVQHGMARRLGLLQLKVHFEQVQKETPCDLDKLHNLLETASPKRSQATRGEQQTLWKVYSDLRKGITRFYGPLEQLLGLLRYRVENENTAVVEGKVIDLVADNGESGPPSPNHEGKSAGYMVIRVDNDEDAFEEGASIQVECMDASEAVKTKLAQKSGLRYFVRSQKQLSQQLGQRVRLHLLPRFSMWQHQDALSRLLAKKTEGAWLDLAKLLIRPGLLVAEHPLEPPKSFGDEDSEDHLLNEEQRRAVCAALSTPHAFFIQGPPGTGKTTVITELVLQLVARGERVLLLAPTHVAVDEVPRRIKVREGVFPIRLTYDETKVRQEVLRFTKSYAKQELTKRIRTPDTSRAEDWRKRIRRQNLVEAGLRNIPTVRAVLADAQAKVQRAEAGLQKWLSTKQSRYEMMPHLLAAFDRKVAGEENVLEVSPQQASPLETEPRVSPAGWDTRNTLSGSQRPRGGVTQLDLKRERSQHEKSSSRVTAMLRETENLRSEQDRLKQERQDLMAAVETARKQTEEATENLQSLLRFTGHSDPWDESGLQRRISKDKDEVNRLNNLLFLELDSQEF